MRLLVTVLLFLRLMTSASAEELTEQQKQDIDAIRNYLLVKFDDCERYADGSFAIYNDLAYIDTKDGEIVPVVVPEIQRFVPKTRFYRAALLAPMHFNLQKIPILVSVREVGERRDIRTAFPGTTEYESPKFTTQFRYVKFDEETQTEAFASAIAKLLLVIVEVREPEVKFGVTFVQEDVVNACELAFWRQDKDQTGVTQTRKFGYLYVSVTEYDEETGEYCTVWFAEDSSFE